jgi:phosphopantothenoylcysteine decarboxylase/phosphopantothenate--cysteine ligase
MGEKKTHQFLVGFALETQNEEENAKGKLEKKNLDMIVLNSFVMKEPVLKMIPIKSKYLPKRKRKNLI